MPSAKSDGVLLLGPKAARCASMTSTIISLNCIRVRFPKDWRGMSDDMGYVQVGNEADDRPIPRQPRAGCPNMRACSPS